MSQYTSEQWRQAAFETLNAAQLLYRAGSYRACANRAYYAAYQAATSVCVKHGDAVKFPRDWNNPSHEQLPELIRQNGDIPKNVRREIGKILIFLRTERENADYRPGQTVNKLTALECLRRSSRVMIYLGVNNG